MITHPAHRRRARTCGRLPPIDSRLRRLLGPALTPGLYTCLTLLASGCGAQGSTLETARNTDEPLSINAAPPSIDAGVVLADRSGYLCLPLERVGLSPNNLPVSLTSSCECVQPSLARYLDSDGSEKQAIFIEYVKESIDSHDVSDADVSDPNPVNLGVVIEMKLEDGSDHGFIANLLHTVLSERRDDEVAILREQPPLSPVPNTHSGDNGMARPASKFAVDRDDKARVQSALERLTGKPVCGESIQRYAKRLGFSWNRFKRDLRKKRDEAASRQPQPELLAESDLDVVYFDEAGGSVKGVDPYGSTPTEKRVTPPAAGWGWWGVGASKGSSVPALGLEHQTGDSRVYLYQGTVNTTALISGLNDNSRQVDQPTVIILDNASCCRNTVFLDQVERWAERGLLDSYLPPRSPGLIAIVRHWKQLQYYAPSAKRVGCIKNTRQHPHKLAC